MAASTKPLILTILNNGEMYGYQIIHRVIRLSGGTLDWSEGMLYPVLHRMEKENFVSGNFWNFKCERFRFEHPSSSKNSRQIHTCFVRGENQPVLFVLPDVNDKIGLF